MHSFYRAHKKNQMSLESQSKPRLKASLNVKIAQGIRNICFWTDRVSSKVILYKQRFTALKTVKNSQQETLRNRHKSLQGRGPDYVTVVSALNPRPWRCFHTAGCYSGGFNNVSLTCLWSNSLPTSNAIPWKRCFKTFSGTFITGKRTREGNRLPFG